MVMALGEPHPASNCAGTFFLVARLVEIIAAHSKRTPLPHLVHARPERVDLLYNPRPETNMDIIALLKAEKDKVTRQLNGLNAALAAFAGTYKVGTSRPRPTKQLGSCQSSEQLSQLRDTATMMYLEAVQKNYGKAGEYSKEFFDQAQRIVSSTEDPARSTCFVTHWQPAIRSQRIWRRGDAGALSEIQPVLSKLEQTAKH
jgi:hypothetical protein